MQLPFRDGAVDVCYSSNVLEHVPDPWLMADEMVRVTRPGGIVVHQLHGLVRPVGRARDRAVALPRRAPGPAPLRAPARAQPKNQYGESLFAVTVARRARLGAHADRRPRWSTVLPRYNPWWRRWLVRVPVLREVVTWNLVLVLRKR